MKIILLKNLKKMLFKKKIENEDIESNNNIRKNTNDNNNIKFIEDNILNHLSFFLQMIVLSFKFIFLQTKKN